MNLMFAPSTSLLVLALLPAVLSAQSQSTPPASQFKVSGIVVSTTTGNPVPHCHIVPTKVERSPTATRRTASQQDGVDTDDRGHFVIPLPSPGSWSLRATARGYRAQLLDQHENFSTTVVLTEQSPSLDVLFRIAPDSVITGIILDEANEPVRQAQVSVTSASPPSDRGQGFATRAFGTTDDRGRYEVAALAPGNYRISVQARPWYAQAAQPFNASRSQTPQLEPSLDVIYPTTWFPGGTSRDEAQTVTLHDGETREADFQLLPIASVHLHMQMPIPDLSTPEVARRVIMPPQVVSVSGNNMGISTFVSGQGQYDIAGLGPGLYRIQNPGQGGEPGRSTIVEITADSSRYMDLSTATVSATVNFKIDGDPEAQLAPITFVDATNDSNIFRSAGSREGGGGGPQRRQEFQPQSFEGQISQYSAFQQPDRQRQRPEQGSGSSFSAVSNHQDRATRTIDLPPGTYLVYQGGSNNFFLSGMTLGTKEIAGRMVTIPAGESSLTLHIATGRATVSGICLLDGKPAVGAMVALVPITADQPGAIAETRRDQTNSDGSYDLDFVIPGQYILIAIDHGWDTHWRDSATLSHYLANGVPLDLRGAAALKQQIIAQRP